MAFEAMGRTLDILGRASYDIEDASVELMAARELLEATKALLEFVRQRFPDDFKEGGKGFTCPHHLRIEEAISACKGKRT